jgi:1-acyl-sn-glycerol-3-phosphate acyltransferase
LIWNEQEENMRDGWTAITHANERKLSDSFVYDIARFIGSPFSFDVVGYENIQTPGPAIYIANHLGTVGPIETILSIPIRFYPWIIAEMTDFKLAPRYLFDDFIRPVLHLGGKFGMLFSTLLTKISVRLLREIGAVSIDRFGGWTPDGFRHSLRLLHEGKNLLIFPEDPLLPLDTETLMRHFMPGFALLCRMFQAGVDTLLPVYPVAVYSGSETVSIGKPEFFHSRDHHRATINSFSELLENRVRRLYLDLKKNADDTLI